MADIITDGTADESVGDSTVHVLPAANGAGVSVTHDNGAEFARHTRLRDGLGMAIYFADPYSSGSEAATRTATVDPPVP